jgi:hypothetical protein
MKKQFIFDEVEVKYLIKQYVYDKYGIHSRVTLNVEQTYDAHDRPTGFYKLTGAIATEHEG